jgi:hypothetical protein
MSGYSQPVLSYLGATDIHGASDANVRISVLVDPSLGSILMFEYRIQQQGISIISPESISQTGFLDTTSCIQSGINNQYVVSVPVNETSLGLVDTYDIYLRVYNQSAGEATPWSDPLQLYLPPLKPTISHAYYDKHTDYGLDDYLYVMLDSSLDTSYVDTIILAYYYQPYGGTVTEWVVSEQLDISLSATGTKYVRYSLNDDVNFGTPIYVAAFALKTWEDASGATHIATSTISDSVEAENSVNSPATLDEVIYNIYESDLQTATLDYTAPGASSIYLFIVDHYKINVYVNGTLETTIDDITSTTYDVSLSLLSGLDCGDDITFTVIAVSDTGNDSLPSNSLGFKYFTKASAPTNLQIGYALINETGDMMDIEFGFSNVANVGCGTPISYRCRLYEDSISDSNLVATEYITYVDAPPSYVGYFNDISGVDLTATFYIVVDLGTTNLNDLPVSPIYGPSTSANANIGDVPVIKNITLYGPYVSFEVYSSVLIGNKQLLVVTDHVSNTIYHHIWESSLTEPSIDEAGQYVFNVLYELPQTPSAGSIINVFASNSYGIGHLTQPV